MGITVAKFKVFTAVEIQIMVFCFLTPCCDVVGYHCFGGPCCLCHPEDGGSKGSETLVSYRKTTRGQSPEDQERWEISGPRDQFPSYTICIPRQVTDVSLLTAV
jgi:hypothetical protein